jgi:hypothetical protein
MVNAPESPTGRVGPYRVLRRLGAGGMGVVYLGHDDAAGVAAAVKVIRPEYATDPRFRARLRHEVAAARRVPRFCTAPVLAADLDADPPWVATEYIDAPTLDAALLEHGRLRGAGLETFAAGVAVALREIHRHGVIHRDLKPSNILLSPLGPRVIDFGIARLEDSYTQLTRTGGVVGTPAYMAPEQLRGEPPTAAVDVFAWASVVAYAATGRPPFGTGTGVTHAIVYGEPDLGDLHQPLRDLVSAAFHKHPTARPTATDLVARLAQAVPAATHRVLAGATVLPAEPAAPPPPRLPATVVPPAQSRPPWLVLALAAVALALVVASATAAAIWYSTRDPGSGAGPTGSAGDTEPAGGIDPCLLGTWTMTSSDRTWDIGGLPVQMSSDSESIRYFRPDGTALLDFSGGHRETGTANGVQYEVVLTGTIAFDYRTSDDVILATHPEVEGEQVVTLNGLELAREPVVAITEPFRYACADDALVLYEPKGTSEYARTD